MKGLKGRSYARILRRKQQLGLLMVNQNQQSFFIYAQALLGLMKTENNLTLIKKRNRDPEKAFGYHGGAIFARWNKATPDNKDKDQPEAVTLSLHFGEVEKKVEYDKETGELRNIIDVQEYLYPAVELETMVRGIEYMLKQQEQFDRLLFEAETNPGFELIEIKEK